MIIALSCFPPHRRTILSIKETSLCALLFHVNPLLHRIYLLFKVFMKNIMHILSFLLITLFYLLLATGLLNFLMEVLLGNTSYTNFDEWKYSKLMAISATKPFHFVFSVIKFSIYVFFCIRKCRYTLTLARSICFTSVHI